MTAKTSGLAIVWWIDHLGSGGSQQVLVRLVKYMAEQGAKQSVVCLDVAPDNELTKEIIEAGAKLYVIGRKRYYLDLVCYRSGTILSGAKRVMYLYPFSFTQIS